MAFLTVGEPDAQERRVRRHGATILLIAVSVLAAVLVALVLFVAGDEELPAAHRGTQRAVFPSADGRLEAAVYGYVPPRRFTPVTEVVLRRAGTVTLSDMVSFGCTEEDDGLTVVAVTVLTDSVVARNANGRERTIRFDPVTLRPESTLGSC